MSDPGTLMRSEIAEGPGAFARALAKSVSNDAKTALTTLNLPQVRAFYTIARGSSDAAANILAYEFMRELGKPMTSLPPSIFSLGHGVDLSGSAALVISQSGASEDLVRSATGARKAGAAVIALTNKPESPVEAAANLTLPLLAGPELAVPATKSVIAAIAAGMALLSALSPAYAARAKTCALTTRQHPDQKSLVSTFLRAQHVYVIGRDTGFGAAQELALKLKETCALHAEAYSSSEVLHGPLQLVTKPLLVVILDTEQPGVQASLDTAESRFRTAGGTVLRLRPSDVGAHNLTPAAAAAALLCLAYPLVLETALALGQNPDAPANLSKVTQTR